MSHADVTSPPPAATYFGDFSDPALLARRVLCPEFCNFILQDSDKWSWIAADIQGTLPSFDTSTDDETKRAGGCFRVLVHSETLASALWERLRPVLPPKRGANEKESYLHHAQHDHDHDYGVWRPVGLNPDLCFIRFEPRDDTSVPPHYDLGFNLADKRNRRSLMGVMFRLSAQDPGAEHTGKNGTTRFLLDTERWKPLDERDFSRRASTKNVLLEIATEQGDALLVDHGVLRDFVTSKGTAVAPVVFLQTHVLYERCCSHEVEPVVAPSFVLTADYDGSVTGPMVASLDQTYRKALAAFNGSFDLIQAAGYFEDGLPGDYNGFDPRWWTGPFDKVHSRLQALMKTDNASNVSKELAVLVTTGAFNPIHKGHIQMMEMAKLELERRGIAVLGGYFCPDHGGYVSSKMRSRGENNGFMLSTTQRLYICELAVSKSDWLMVDRWAALCAPGPVNFTRILDYVSQMLAHNVRTHQPIHVVYAFGGDNAMLSLAFVQRGSCVCVLREGSRHTLEEASKYALVADNPRIMFSWNRTPDISSTKVRQGDLSGLPRVIEEELARIQARPNGCPEAPVSFYMRDEGPWAVAPWVGLTGKHEELAMAYQGFCTGLREAFTRAFASKPRMLPPVNIITVHLADQGRVFQERFGNQQVISLDPCLSGTVNLQLSRRFRPLGQHSCGFIARYGAPPLAEQISRIPAGKYILFDDDSFSGQTEQYVRSLLEQQCTVTEFQTLCDAQGPLTVDNINDHQTLPPSPSGGRLNLIDCRDFLAGAREGGLCLELWDGSVCRAPYVLPYVSPHYRASVPIVAEVGFSREVWRLNKDFFTSLGLDLRLRDMAPAFRELGDSLKFPDDMMMVNFCAWHLQRLDDMSS